MQRSLVWLTSTALLVAGATTVAAPLGLPPVPVPDDNPQTEAKIMLGDKLFHGGLNSSNTMSCDQCHPNASNVHPETYPKFQQQLGKVAVLGEMINWCIMNPLESEPLALDSPDMVALQAYILQERRGVALAPGKH